MIRYLLTLLIASFVITGNSQQNNFRFSHISTQDGLSASRVRTIYQDKYGFMWFGTSDGLNRYDGYTMQVFKPDDTSDFSLIDGSINHISERKDGMLWICTNQGVNVFNLEGKTFLPFPYLDKVRVTHTTYDKKGYIWFTTYSGVFRYNPLDSTMQNFRNIPEDPTSLISDLTERCFVDSEGKIWIATQKGLDKYLPESSSFEHYNPNTKDHELTSSIVVDVIADNSQRLWVGLTESGIDILLDDKDKKGKQIRRDIIGGTTSRLLIDKSNKLWIGNNMGNGLYIVDLNTFSLEDPDNINVLGEHETSWTLKDNTISSLFQDKQDGIWIGTYAGGVYFYSAYMKQFNVAHSFPGEIPELNDDVINCFLNDGKYFWIGTEGGLFRFDQGTRELIKYAHEPQNINSIGARGILSLYRDSRGNLWIGTWNGSLNRYNYEKDNFTRFPVSENTPGILSNFNIFSIHEDQRGFLWIGTNGGGLNQYDYSTGKFRAFMPEANDPGSIYHNAVNDICETSDGELYVSVYHSVEKFNYETETFEHFYHKDKDTTSLSGGKILDIFEDSHKNIWIGTSTGLNLLNKEQGTFRRFGIRHGLPNNSIQSIIEDDGGNLWIGTNDGLVKFVDGVNTPLNPVFKSYYIRDGIRGNEFVRRAVCKQDDGWLYFGGTKGYSYFHPDNIIQNKIPPKIVLTDFRLFNVNSEVYSSIIQGDINLQNRIRLNYDQCDFVLQFAALNYVDSEKNKYKYILEGYEKEWHEVGRQREATYTNIDPGKYTFKVIGSNNDGVWSTEPKVIEIAIQPPWWGTWVFRIFAIVFLGLIIYGVIMMRLRLYYRQKKLLEEKVAHRTSELSDLNALLEEKQEEISLQNEELSEHRSNLEIQVQVRTEEMKKALQRAEEADKLKSAFLANMSHEIRTPMNAIVGFAALINNEDFDEEERRNFAEIISNNCNTLMVLINDILEISLIEANQIEIKNEPINVINIFEELESYFNLNNKKDLKVRFIKESEDEELIIKNDLTRFRQIFNNLLNNAYKYTEKGFIDFGYQHINGEIRFYVKDTGIGIAESEYQNIFNFFHKIDKGENQFYRGAGIGLSISNKLAELMGGKIWLESEPEIGTTFYICFDSSIYRKDSARPGVSSIPTINESDDFSNKTIIVAEDDAGSYYLIEKILKNTKARLVWAKNGKQAVDIISKMEVYNDCLVIMDIKMPVMSGLRAAEEIKKINPDIPMIAVTAYAQIQNKEKILKLNFVDYISKPLKPSELMDTIRTHIHRG